MISSDKILRIFLLSVCGIWFAYILESSTQEDFIFDEIILLFIAIVGLIVLIWSIIKDIKEYNFSRKLTSYLPSSIGLLAIILNISLCNYQADIKNSPTLISGFNDGGFNGFSIDFKQDGKYVMANGSGLGQSYFYGTYTLIDSIITIDKFNIDNCIKTNKLVIRTEDYYPKDSLALIKSQANYITQIDKNGKELDKDFRFRVTEDNRNNK
jgi:hypothetical protein